MKDFFEKTRMESGPLAKYPHLTKGGFFLPQQEGDIATSQAFAFAKSKLRNRYDRHKELVSVTQTL